MPAYPTLVNVFPANGSTASLADAVFYLVFDEMLGPTPVVTYLLPGGVTPNTAYVDYEQNVMVISLTNLSLTGVYTFTVQDGTVKDQNFNVDPEHITFTVDLESGLPPIAPHLVATSFWPGDSQTSVTPGERLQFEFSAAGLVKGSGIIELHTDDGTLVQSIDMASAGTNGLLFAGGNSLTLWGLPLHPGQSYYLYVPAGALVGSDGPSDAFTYHFTAAGTLDISPPVLAASTPADNQAAVPLATDIKLTFSESIKLGSGNFGIYRVSDNSLVENIAASSASIDTDGKTVILTTGILLDRATQYYVRADAGTVLDMSDNPFAGISDPSALNFTTAQLPSLPSDTQPWVVSGDAQLAAGRTLSVTHDGQFNNEFSLLLQPSLTGSEFVFFNYGAIQGNVTGFPGVMAGISIDGGAGQFYLPRLFLRNYGSIDVNGDMSPLGVNNIGGPTGDAAIGIYDPNGEFPNIENAATGTIAVTAWRAWGIYQNGGQAGNPINRGAIIVHGTDAAVGFYTVQNGTPSFTNTGLVSVKGGIGATGVSSEFGNIGVVNNSGRIDVTADTNPQLATGIGFASEGDTTIVNSGEISAAIAINIRDIGNGSGTLSITNTGQIVGDIYMGAATSNVFDGSVGSYNGTIHGGRGANTIHAGSGNSTLISGPGNDMLDGGPGLDTAVYSAARAAYTIFQTGAGQFSISGPDGTDTLIAVEFARFTDQVVSLAGNHGPASDFTGQGRSDIVWQNAGGQPVVWLMNGTTVLNRVAVGSNPGSNWHVKGTGDFDGDGKADLLWQNDNGQAAIWLLNGMAVTGSGVISTNPGPSWHVMASGDFDGDGKADILWQRDSGQAAIWLMNGATVAGGGAVSPNPGPSWHVRATGDFDGDGKSDILWQNDSGQAAIWLMNGLTLAGGGVISPTPDPSWHVVGAGDFDGDGKADILWQNDSGQVAIWLMNGASVSSRAIEASNPGTSWHIKGTADLNGDGLSDILWQSNSDQAMAWQMNGTTVVSNALLGVSPGPNWQIANYGSTTAAQSVRGDFDGDRNPDILWQSDSGQAAIWLLNGTTVTGGGAVSPTPSSSWHVKGSGDFDGDGKADILWQNDNGQAAVWLMNGATLAGGGTVTTNPDPNWHVITARDFDSDGKSDILWQNDSGQVAIWFMNGSNLAGGAVLSPSPDPSWHLKAAADFDGDGKADILWQNDNGQAAIWLMNGTTLTGGVAVGGNPGTSWHVMGAGDFDGDGKADILWQNDNGQTHIWLMNSTTRLSATDVGANPGASWRVKGTADLNGDGMSDILWQNTSGQAMGWLMSGTNVQSTVNIGPNPGSSWHVIANSG